MLLSCIGGNVQSQHVKYLSIKGFSVQCRFLKNTGDRSEEWSHQPMLFSSQMFLFYYKISKT